MLMNTSVSHLSKRPSDLKLNGTLEKKPISSTVSNTYLNSVPSFVESGSSRNHLLTSLISSNQQLLFNGFWSYHSQQNGAHHVKGYGKLCQKMVSFLVYHFVWGHFAFCNMWYTTSQKVASRQIKSTKIRSHWIILCPFYLDITDTFSSW